MKLSAWLEREGIGNGIFGTRIGRSAEAVRRYASGERIPDRDTMPLIVRETSGDVMPADFYDLNHDRSDAAGGVPTPFGNSENLSAGEAVA